jgi:pimeloyl-ACP methyl ester carboxylesterase
MQRRSLLASTTLATAGVGVSGVASGAAPKTFVLVHGAWHSGWCWSNVASILRGRGHAVFTPTQTHSHLLSKPIDLEVFITDIANVDKWEDLNEVVLVGHSFGGNDLRRFADRMRDRIRQLIYLDAVILEDG